MAEYGGHEDYDDVLGRLEKADDAIDGLIAKEQRYRGELADTSKVEGEGAEASERRRRAQQETIQVKKRAEAVEGVETAKVNQSTEAIERNARAREKLNRATVNTSRAVRGAGDPMFGRAYEMAQRGQGTQYAFRRDLPQVGSRRAAAIQEAISAGFKPQTAPRQADRPLTRLPAAQIASERAEAEYTRATRELTNLRRRKAPVGDEEILAATTARDTARDKKTASKIELESATKEAAARAENAAAARVEAAARQRSAAAALAEAKNVHIGQQALAVPGGAAAAVPRLAPHVEPPRRGAAGPGQLSFDDESAASAAQKRQALALATENEAKAASRARAQRIDDYYRNAAVASQQATRAVMQQGVAFGTTSQAMYKHGALTSEFISAAARGETTLKELGNQAVITAGKFGGWTAAATALYGAAAAIGQVGKGALDANDGVQQLTRVISNVPGGGKAEGALADLAKQFNVPIDVASDAVYRMGQRYHDFDDAVSAARASLYAFKTGEVDVETSTRQLISATSGFGMSANELASRYDQINQAQNVFGVKVGETTAGISKAAGAFSNAGGDFDHLLALIVAINRATGVTGAEVGTALSRAVTQIRVPTHITKLKDLGVDIDPSDLQGTIISAMAAVRKAPASQRDELSNVLASQIFGNQYARQLAPVLRDQRIYNEALNDTSPEKSKGSAQNELKKVLGEVREQIDSLGISLQVLGQRLAEAGAFAPLVGVLKLLDGALDIANGLVGAFNQIPQPLRQALTLLGQGYILLRAMRGLGVTDKLLGGPLSSLAGPESRLKTFAARGLRDARDEQRNVVERAGRTAFTASGAAAVAQRQVVDFEPQVKAAMRMAEGSEEQARILADAEGYQNKANAAQQKLATAERELLENKKIAYGLERQLATVQKLSPDQVAPYLRDQQIPHPNELAVPNMQGITYMNAANKALVDEVDREMQAAARAGAPGLSGATTGQRLTRSLGRGGGALTASITSQMQAMTGAFVKYSDDVAKKIGGEAASSGRAVRAVERGAIGVTNITGRVVGGIEGAASGLRGSRAQLSQLAGSFSLLDKALIGVSVAAVLGEVLKSASNSAAEAIEGISKDASSISKQNERMKDLAKEARKRGRVGEVGLGLIEVGDPRNWDDIARGDYKSPAQRRRDQAKLELETDKRNRETQEARRAKGLPVPFQYSGQLIKEIEQDAKDRKEGLISQREFDRRMANHAKETGQLLDGSKKNRQRAKLAIAAAQRAAGDSESYGQSLRGLDDSGLQKEMQATGAAVSMTGLGGGNLKRLQQQYQEAQRRFKSGSVSDLTNLASARQSYYQTLIGEVNRELQAALLGARSESERQAAFARAKQRYADAERGVRERIRKERDGAQEVEKARQEAQPDINAPQLQATPPGGGLQGTHPFAQDAAEKETRERAYIQAFIDRTRNAKTKRHLEMLRDTSNEKLGLTGRFEKIGAGLVGATILSQGKGPNEDLLGDTKGKLGPDVPGQVKNQRERSKRIKDRVEKKDHELTQAERELQVQAYEDRQTGRQIKTDLAVSQTRDQGEQAAIRVNAAQIQVRDARREFGNKSRQYRQALIELNNARNQQADQIVADVEADNALLMARAGADPAAQARAAVQAAQNTLAAMKRAGSDPNAIKQQQAEVINARTQQQEQQRSEQEQIAGLQSQIAAAKADGDPIAAARAAQRAARQAMGRARTRVERLQATLDLITANNQMEDALREREQARFDLLSSRTEDPEEQSRIDVQRARVNLRGTKGTERIRARAEYNRARQAYRNQRIDSRLDDINFNLEMDKISNEEAARQIEELAKMKGISKQRKRELIMQAKRLRDEASGEYELDLGNIKMPTLYEVRRYVQGGAGSPNGGQVVTDNRQFNVTITTPDAARAFAGELERTNGSSAKATARSMGAR